MAATPVIRARPTFAIVMLCVLAGAASLAAGPQRHVERTFDADPADVPPAGFMFAAMRQREPGTWLVRRFGDNGYLAHPAVAGRRGFSLAIADGEPMDDVAVTVRLRLSGGGRTAGLISRYQDPRNYYMTVLDLEDGELRMFRVFEGNRNQIEFRGDLELDPESWHTLKVIHRGDRATALLGGIPVFEDGQRVNRWFPAGRCGVMATGDTDAWFDDFRIEPARRGHTDRP
jgi:hypothetical protein